MRVNGYGGQQHPAWGMVLRLAIYILCLRADRIFNFTIRSEHTMTAPNPLAAAIEALAREIAGTVLDGLHSEPLEYVLRRGYAAMGLSPSFAAKMCLRLAECEVEDQHDSTLRTALAEAEGSVTLPVRWDNSADGKDADLSIGPISVGCIYYANARSKWVAVAQRINFTSPGHTDIAAAKAALLAAVRGETT